MSSAGMTFRSMSKFFNKMSGALYKTLFRVFYNWLFDVFVNTTETGFRLYGSTYINYGIMQRTLSSIKLAPMKMLTVSVPTMSNAAYFNNFPLATCNLVPSMHSTELLGA